MASHGTYLVADIYCGDWIAEEGARGGWSADVIRKNEETTDAQREGFTKAVKAGVSIAYGTDSGVYPHAMVARQMAYMVRYGMTPMEAIRSATVVASELMGWQDRVGAVAPGQVRRPRRRGRAIPLQDIALLESVGFVMKGGAVIRS